MLVKPLNFINMTPSRPHYIFDSRQTLELINNLITHTSVKANFTYQGAEMNSLIGNLINSTVPLQKNEEKEPESIIETPPIIEKKLLGYKIENSHFNSISDFTTFLNLIGGGAKYYTKEGSGNYFWLITQNTYLVSTENPYLSKNGKAGTIYIISDSEDVSTRILNVYKVWASSGNISESIYEISDEFKNDNIKLADLSQEIDSNIKLTRQQANEALKSLFRIKNTTDLLALFNIAKRDSLIKKEYGLN